ncbi:MAG: hypothetical protein OHK0015_28170 [Chloroflexi bacterium OHK40]
MAEEIGHALAASDANLVVRLLAVHGPGFVDRGEAHTLQGWLDALPHAALLANPRLCLVQAQVLVHDRRVSAVSPFLQAAEAGARRERD